MNQTPRQWTDLELEQYTDEALDQQTADALAEALREDAALRRRLASIQRLDAAAAETFALVMSGASHSARPRATLAGRVMSVVVLASVAIVFGAAVLWMFRGSSPGSDPLAHRTHAALIDPDAQGPGSVDSTAATPRGSPIRTVFEIVSRMPQADDASAPGLAQPSDGPSTLVLVPEPTAPRPQVPYVADPQSWTGTLPGPGAPMIAEAPAIHAARERELLSLGRTLRSAITARLTLDAMTSAEQLEACRVWARDPSLRPVAFERLAILQEDPALAPECARIASILNNDAELVAWLRSHNLRTAMSSRQAPARQ